MFREGIGLGFIENVSKFGIFGRKIRGDWRQRIICVGGFHCRCSGVSCMVGVEHNGFAAFHLANIVKGLGSKESNVHFWGF